MSTTTHTTTRRAAPIAAETFLDRIVFHKRQEVRQHRDAISEDELRARIAAARPTRPFLPSLQRGTTRLICEVKRGSPSKGLFAPDLDARTQAQLYVQGGAGAISVLTDEQFFWGCLTDLHTVATHVPIPVLRKDFILDCYQLLEARAAGADLVLLIVAMLADAQLGDLLQETRALGMQPLVEVHTVDEAERAIAAGADLIGINNRDLKTFKVDMDTTRRVLDRLPDTCYVVSESGIDSPQAIAQLREWGVHAALVGEALVRSTDSLALLQSLVAAGFPAGISADDR